MQTLTLRERDDWDAEKLKELLDSEGRNVQDITGEYLALAEKESSEMKEEDRPVEWLNFGDDSLLVLSDGQKVASFARNTCVSYVDEALKKNCDAIYKKAPETDVTKGMTVSTSNVYKIDFNPLKAEMSLHFHLDSWLYL